MFGRKKKKADAPTEKMEGVPQPQGSEPSDVLDWEANVIDLYQKSERKAWTVAKFSATGFVLSVVAIGLLMPLKESVPYVMRVDKSTGVIDVVTSVRGKNVSNDEVQDKYFINNLVVNREGYDWHTIKNSYLVTHELSSPEVFKPFETLYQSGQAPNKLYGTKFSIKVEVTSITLADGDTATVRFAKVRQDAETGNEVERTNWIATIGYKYNQEIFMKESQRLINPFGFKAISYQVVPEINSLSK
mgnify:CR=1 FL=1